MMRPMMDRVHLRFLAARLVWLALLAASSGCALHPPGWFPSGDAMSCGCGEAVPCDDCGECCDDGCGDACTDEVACQRDASHGPKCRCPRCHLYSPEAGIFNFCMPPASLAALPPPPPGRFFPVPVRPVFAPRPSPAPPPPGW